MQLGIVIAIVKLSVSSQVHAAAIDDVILDASNYPIRVGIYSKFTEFRNKLSLRLAGCKVHPVIAEDTPGSFGPATASEISALSVCDETLAHSGALSANGSLTLGVWQAIMGNSPPPDVEERADALTLTFEATDFADPPEWNFCQDNPGPSEGRAERAIATSECFNATDPCSLLTWGPRGATAGQGREIQWILRRTAETDPAAIDRAFGAEAANVRRFGQLSGPQAETCDGTSALEQFMCAAWIDTPRRQAWMRGLQLLGADPAVRANYRALYRSYPFDGEKLERYGRLWASLALVPSEIDFAFFYDRATHIGGPPDDEALISELGDCIRAETLAGNTHAAARRCLSLRHPHPTLPTDRLGRDVAYYVDAYPDSALSPRELSTWREHIPLSARTSVGLSDARNYPLERAFNAADPSGETPEANDELTPAEAACPLFVRAPQRHLPGTP